MNPTVESRSGESPSGSRVTWLLQAMGDGDDRAGDELLAVLYDELHRLATAHMKDTPPGHTLQPTALVNEAYLRLMGGESVAWENRRHFFFAAARAMHDILVEQARKKTASKRGGGWKRVDPENLEVAIEAPAEDMLALAEALQRLERRDPAKAQLVYLRFFAGLTERETAAVLGLPRRTFQRQWRTLRVRLFRELYGKGTGEDE